MTSPTLFDALGGADGMLAVARAHHARCLADPLLSHAFEQPSHPEHVARLAAYLGEAMGGPAAYSALGHDRSFMLRLHCGDGADPDEWGGRFLACFLTALDDAGAPADPALRTACHEFMAAAVAEVVSYFAPGSEVPDGLPVTRWPQA